MGDLNFLDFENNEPGEWTTIEIGQPGEDLILIELTNDEQIIVMSNKRNVYRSPDQGVTFEYEGQMSRLRYWGKRIKHQWQHWLIILNWLVGKAKLWWLARNYDRHFNR